MTIRQISLALAGVLALQASAVVAANANSSWEGGVAVVQENRVEHHVILGGTVVPARQVTIAAQLPGRVEFLAGAEGDAFASDTTLVRLNDDELLAQRQAAIAQMGNADAALRNAGVQYTRELVAPNSTARAPGGMGMPSMFDTMFTRNFGNMMGINDTGLERHADLVSRGTTIEQARNSFLQAKSRLDEIDAKLRDTTGNAPFDGVITKKMVEVGDTVQPGQPLLEFSDIRSLQIQVEVPARLMGGIKDGQFVQAQLDARNSMVQVRVAQVFPMADPSRHTVRVKFDLPPNAPAGPGMYAEVKLPGGMGTSQTLPIVPRSAVIHRGSLPAVFVINDKGDTELRVIRLGEDVDQDQISVLSGLRGGERVVRNPPPGMGSQTVR